MGDTSGPIMGPYLGVLLDNARKHKKEMGDDFVSVEHFVLAFHLDKRFGQQLLRSLQLSEKDMRDAIQAVRGSQRVIDQSMSLLFHILLKTFNCSIINGIQAHVIDIVKTRSYIWTITSMLSFLRNSVVCQLYKACPSRNLQSIYESRNMLLMKIFSNWHC